MKTSVILPAVLFFVMLTSITKSQTFNFSLTTNSVCYSGNPATVQVVQTSPSPLSVGYGWAVISGGSPTCQATWTNTSPSGTAATITFSCCGTFSVFHYAYSSLNPPILSNTVAKTFTVNCLNPPALSIMSSAGSSTVCAGTSVNLTGVGANTYTWSNGSTNTTIAVTPTATTSYSLMATGSNGCAGNTGITLNVSNCAAIGDLNSNFVSIFPNPAMDILNLNSEVSGQYTYEIKDIAGRIVASGIFEKQTSLNVSGFSAGVYILNLHSESGKWQSKLIINNYGGF